MHKQWCCHQAVACRHSALFVEIPVLVMLLFSTSEAHTYYRKHVEHCRSSGKEAFWACVPKLGSTCGNDSQP